MKGILGIWHTEVEEVAGVGTNDLMHIIDDLPLEDQLSAPPSRAPSPDTATTASDDRAELEVVKGILQREAPQKEVSTQDAEGESLTGTQWERFLTNGY